MKPHIKLLDQLKKVDCGQLPPCKKVLHKKIQRSQMIAIVWFNADQPNPNEGLDPADYGWYKAGHSFVPKWYDGPPLPTANDLHVNELSESSDEEDSEAI